MISSENMGNFKDNQKGFTLVELLASVIVLVAIGSIVAGIVTSSVRGTNKTNTIESIRQNGNYVINQISKDVQYAQPFDGVITGLGNSASDYVSSCPYSAGSPPVPENTTYKYITVQLANSVVVKYNCNDTTLSANGTPLIDSSISISGCSLTCTRTTVTDVPIIAIKFDIAATGSAKLAENTGKISFETSVTLRNYRK